MIPGTGRRIVVIGAFLRDTRRFALSVTIPRRSGVEQASARKRIGRFAPLRFAPLRFAPPCFAPPCFAPLRVESRRGHMMFMQVNVALWKGNADSRVGQAFVDCLVKFVRDLQTLVQSREVAADVEFKRCHRTGRTSRSARDP